MTRLVIIDSGIANVASVRSAFRAIGLEPDVTRDPTVVADASHLVLPGVGAFGAGLASLRAAGLEAPLRDAVARDIPLLAVCLGLQLLTEGSDEAPDASGLGVIPGRCIRLPDTVRVPQLGWNAVTAARDGVLTDGMAAYANSYALPTASAGWRASWTTHGHRFVAALERGNLLACQFHPELSGSWGLAVLRRWAEGRTGGRTNGDMVASPDSPAATASPTHRVIPCLDVANGRVVKGVRFQSLRDAGDPAERAALYEAQGADELVLLDVGASPENRDTQVETVRRVREAIHIPFTVGGGVRSVGDAARLLAAGADKVSVNTAAVADPTLVSRLAEAFGTQCVVLALDARRAGARPDWAVLVSGGRAETRLDAVKWAEEGVRRGAGEILLTSWDQDGTRAGCDLELIRSVRARVPVPLIASGGVGTRQDFADAFDAGADAGLAASIFHDGDDTVAGVKQWLAARGYGMRP